MSTPSDRVEVPRNGREPRKRPSIGSIIRMITAMTGLITAATGLIATLK